MYTTVITSAASKISSRAKVKLCPTLQQLKICSMVPSLDEKLGVLASADDLPLDFQLDLPDLKKPVKAYMWRDKKVPLPEKVHLCIYTHGAGGTCLSPGSSRLCEALTEPSNERDEGVIVVLGFDGAMHLGSRTKAFVALIHWAAQSQKVASVSLAGRSMGCRAAVLAVKDCTDVGKLSRKLLLQSYPLIGAGKGTKDAERKQILQELSSDAYLLFQSGDHDDICPLQDLRELQDSMVARTILVTLEGVDHGLQLASGLAPRGSKSKLEEQISNTAARIGREWLLTDDVASLGDGAVHVLTEGDDSTVLWSGFGKAENRARSSIADRNKRSAPVEPTAAEPPPGSGSGSTRKSKRTKR